MHIDTSTFLAILTFISFAFAVVGIAGSWRASRSGSALTQYRETARAWEGKSRAQDALIADLQADAATKDRRIAELDGKVTVLQDALTGRAAWEILETKISEALQLIGETRTEVKQVHQMLETP